MKKSSVPKPTDAEVAILRVLWRHGPSTVREIWERLTEQQTGYTTVLKLMQIMVGKGLLLRNESQRSHVYQAACSEEQTQRQVVGHLLDRLFSGSATNLVMQALATKRATPAELEQIRKLITDMEKGAK